MDELEGKVAIVTGAGRGLGAAISRELCSAGVRLALVDVSRRLLASVIAELGRPEEEVIPLCGDVSDADQVAAIVKQAIERFERLDILVNNAGIDYTLGIEELSVEQWDRVIGTNLRGPFLLSRAVFPVMRRQGGGHIVNIVSTAAKRTWANASAYHASKWGLLGLSHALLVEGRALGIRVTAVVSGGMRTPFLLERFPDIDIRKLQPPENVARVVRFVLSQPPETVLPEIMVLPVQETSWP